MPRSSPPIVLLPRQRRVLEHLIRSPTSEHRIVERARIIVTADDGEIPAEQSVKLGIDRQRIRRWRERFAEASDLLNAAEMEPVSNTDLEHLVVDVLRDSYRSGTKPKFTPEQVAQVLTLACEQPAELGLPFTHWTAAELAREAKKRKIVEDISSRHLARFFEGDRDPPASVSVLAQPDDHRPEGARTRGERGLRRVSLRKTTRG
jgi:hypothetical protein